MIYLIIISLLLNLVLSVLLIVSKKKPKKKVESKELADFMQDIKVWGYGVVRVEPDSILYISPKNKR